MRVAVAAQVIMTPDNFIVAVKGCRNMEELRKLMASSDRPSDQDIAACLGGQTDTRTPGELCRGRLCALSSLHLRRF